ncbi:MAG: biotin--[acetyl-CoA-carboxylase] ligase [Bacteroidales bacterium]|jgi:BirA family biotin operon repressor/biotin-[acetyl-CoA-carboxylase] ligase|nr:biotin--[acetyl-CoA-carboxylase] ligase [Bacteroidales bacterium]
MNKHFAEIDSTNAEMHRWLGSGEVVNSYSYITADFQSAGRGQVGNKWESEPKANLLFSAVVKPNDLEVHKQFYLSMAISLAIVDGIEHVLGGRLAEMHIKWPNDIYYKNGKLGGILIENTLSNRYITTSIIGLGLNVNQREFYGDAPNPISLLNITGKTWPVEDFAKSIIESLKSWIPRVDIEDWTHIVGMYMSRLYRYDGQPHTFCADGVTFDATIKRIEPDGRMVLATSNGNELKFFFKEVEYVLS